MSAPGDAPAHLPEPAGAAGRPVGLPPDTDMPRTWTAMCWLVARVGGGLAGCIVGGLLGAALGRLAP